MPRFTLEVDIEGSMDDVDALYGALTPEHEDEFPGVRTQLSHRDERTARLTITGEDPPSVRAAANAHLRWIRTIEDVLGVGRRPDDTEVL